MYFRRSLNILRFFHIFLKFLLFSQVSEQPDNLPEAAPTERELVVVQLHEAVSRRVGVGAHGGLQPRHQEEQGFVRVSF